MSQILIDRIRKGREVRQPLLGATLVMRRPTDLEFYERGGRLTPRDVFEFSTGWDGVTEQIIFGNGEPHPLAFDKALLAEWLSDKPEELIACAQALSDAWSAHRKAAEDAKKKSPTG